jgi:hypothetical protein
MAFETFVYSFNKYLLSTPSTLRKTDNPPSFPALTLVKGARKQTQFKSRSLKESREFIPKCRVFFQVKALGEQQILGRGSTDMSPYLASDLWSLP